MNTLSIKEIALGIFTIGDWSISNVALISSLFSCEEKEFDLLIDLHYIPHLWY